MSSYTYRPLVAGEESLFDSFPDPLPSVPKIGYADGLATGGYDPSRTWIALRDGRVVARAAWVLPPGSVGDAWLERFELIDSPAVGAALLSAAHDALGGPKPYHAALPADWRTSSSVQAAVSDALEAAEMADLKRTVERFRLKWTDGEPALAEAVTIRAATGPDEVTALVARVTSPDVLTGSETARAVTGIDLATDPLPWLTGEAAAWHVALDGDRPLGLVGTAGDACWPLIGYLGLLGEPDSLVRPALLTAAHRALVAGGAEEIVADVEADRPDVLADLEQAGFNRIRARLTFEPLA